MKDQESTTRTTETVRPWPCGIGDHDGCLGQAQPRRSAPPSFCPCDCHKNLSAFQPVAEGEQWRQGAGDSLMDRRRVYDAEGRVVTIAASEYFAVQIVRDHSAAQAVPKLVEALKHALVCSGTPDDCDACREAQQLCN
jgi:hypothetical protein